MPDAHSDAHLNSLAAKDLAYALHPYTNLAAHQERGPLVIVRGEGIHVWDEDGKEYIDALGGLWCTSLGFSEPRLVKAAKEQLEKYFAKGGIAASAAASLGLVFKGDSDGSKIAKTIDGSFLK